MSEVESPASPAVEGRPPKNVGKARPPATAVSPARSGGATWGKAVTLAMCVGFLAAVIGWRVGEGSPPSASSVDVGFSQDMISHHDQAVQMSLLVLAKPGIDADVAGYAQEIITDQRYEIGVMTAWLNDWGYAVDGPDHPAMAWMSDGSTPVTSTRMPGMQTDAAMVALRDATAPDANRLFLAMMIAHHRGGIHMARDAAVHAADAKVRALATRIVSAQQGDIIDFHNLQRRLGFPLTQG